MAAVLLSQKRPLEYPNLPPAKLAKISQPTPCKPPISDPFSWRTSLGKSRRCLYGEHLDPRPTSKVAAFDLDGTVIAELSFEWNPLAPDQWEWWNACVPGKLAEAVEAGYSIVIVTNQAGLSSPQHLNEWKLKIKLVSAAIPDVPFRILAATARDNYRKPLIGMWEELERMFAADGITIDKSQSFYVGDSAARVYPGTWDIKPDFSGTDRKWALNVGIPFLTPEEYFLGEEPHPCYDLRDFHVSSLRSLPLFMPTSTPLIPIKPTQELVLFVGYPCIGKTTLFRTYFGRRGYQNINLDTFKTLDKCVEKVQDAISAGRRCVVDSTNADRSTRRAYLDVAAKHNVPVRCMLFSGSLDLAWHNNLYRAYGSLSSQRHPPRDHLPMSAFTFFRDKYEEPKLEEGFTHIKRIYWVWSGTEEERGIWSKWWQLDEKR